VKANPPPSRRKSKALAHTLVRHAGSLVRNRRKFGGEFHQLGTPGTPAAFAA
jgi:hypothetical protein